MLPWRYHLRTSHSQFEETGRSTGENETKLLPLALLDPLPLGANAAYQLPEGNMGPL